MASRQPHVRSASAVIACASIHRQSIYSAVLVYGVLLAYEPYRGSFPYASFAAPKVPWDRFSAVLLAASTGATTNGEVLPYGMGY